VDRPASPRGEKAEDSRQRPAGVAPRKEDRRSSTADRPASPRGEKSLALVNRIWSDIDSPVNWNANVGRGHTNYLSAKICEELVEVMGKRVLNEITSRIRESRYYSVSLDSTPDESHVDQLTLVFRYMEKTKPVERFVKFMPNQGHKAQDMFDGLVEFLNAHAIDIKHCRGQSYDNAAAMSGRYNGLQAKVAEENNLAAWIPCAGKSVYYMFNYV